MNKLVVIAILTVFELVFMALGGWWLCRWADRDWIIDPSSTDTRLIDGRDETSLLRKRYA